MIVLGQDAETDQDILLSDEARKQGVYIIGTTGTGKTTLLKNIAYQDMVNGEGVCVLDPHGDLVDELLAIVPKHREQDVIVFAPGDDAQRQRPLGLNILDCDRDDPRQRRRVTSTVLDTLYKLFYYSWGPRMEDLLRNSILTLMETPGTTLLDLWLLLASKEHRKRYTFTKEQQESEKSDLKDEYLRQFWDVQFKGYTNSPRDLTELVGSSLNKIGRFLADLDMRHIVSQPESALKIRHIMDERKILLVNLSKGDLGEDNSALLGAVLVNLFLIAALTRRDTPSGERTPYHLIVDEYQSWATASFPTLQSEARKYGIDLIVAHQYRDQLDDLNRGSTLNAGNMIVLRTSGMDAQELAPQFDNAPPPPDTIWEALRLPSQQFEGYYTRGELEYPVPDKPRPYSDLQAERANKLAGQGILEAQCRILVNRKLEEHTIKIQPLDVAGNKARADRIRQATLDIYGKPVEEVEEDIRNRIKGLVFDTPKEIQEQSDR